MSRRIILYHRKTSLMAMPFWVISTVSSSAGISFSALPVTTMRLQYPPRVMPSRTVRCDMAES